MITKDQSFRRMNPDGAFPAVLACDHASRALPPHYGTLGLDDVDLLRHIAWDIGAAAVTESLSRLLDAPAIFSAYSRLLIDCNRNPGDPTEICEASDGTQVPGNCDLDEAERLRRRKLYFEPYHQALAHALDQARARHGAPALISIHSFTPVMQAVMRPWHVGVLWNRDTRLSAPLIAALRDEPGMVVGDNEPYDGRDHVGYTMNRHAESLGLPHVLIEIRQDLIDTDETAREWAERLARIFTSLFTHHYPFLTA